MSEELPLPPTESAPKRIGKYRILRQIARGGMAEIYLASASGIEGFEKLCVLKRILPMLATNREFVQMFLDEARIAASLMHSNIAQVFDIGADQGSYYFVMELLRGEDVRRLLQTNVQRKRFIPYEHVVTVITGVCAGLHYAHEMHGKDGRPLQLVHRDISPQNVFVTHDGGVKLCDFGIAKSAAQLTETRVGTLKGKIRYMSPEQCSSDPLDRRSDVFSLSIVLWEMMTLRRLFTGKSDFEIFKAIVETPPPPPSEFRRDVPAGLEAIVMKGLSHRREDRFQTAQELQLALEDWARAERVPTSPIRLAGFMSELFGPPATTVEGFLERTTEGDALARGTRRLHADHEIADAQLFFDAEAADDARAFNDDDAATKTSQPSVAMPRPPSEVTTDAAVPLLPDPPPEPSVTDLRRTSPPRGLVAGAVIACVAALVALVLRGGHPDAAAPPVAPAAKAAPAPVGDPSPSAEGLRAPPRMEQPPPAPRVAVTRPPPARPAPAVRKVKRSEPVKKHGTLDDLLPP